MIRKGMTLIEVIVSVSIIAVFSFVLAPRLAYFVQYAKSQIDLKNISEIKKSIELSAAKEEVFDEIYYYACDNNFLTYTDSSGVYGRTVNENEYWCPDGEGRCITITWNPYLTSGNRTVYKVSDGVVNDLCFGNGSITKENRIINKNYKVQMYVSEMGSGAFYACLRQSIGEYITVFSSDYRKASISAFIRFGSYYEITSVFVSFNGCGITSSSLASLGSYEREVDGTATSGGTGIPCYNTSSLYSDLSSGYKEDLMEKAFGGVDLPSGSELNELFKNATEISFLSKKPDLPTIDATITLVKNSTSDILLSIAGTAYYVYPEVDYTKIYANENCRGLFEDNLNLRRVKLFNFDTSKTQNMAYMFSGCENLKEVEIAGDFSTESLKYCEMMFYHCYSIEGETGSSYDEERIEADMGNTEGYFIEIE